MPGCGPPRARPGKTNSSRRRRVQIGCRVALWGALPAVGPGRYPLDAIVSYVQIGSSLMTSRTRSAPICTHLFPTLVRSTDRASSARPLRCSGSVGARDLHQVAILVIADAHGVHRNAPCLRLLCNIASNRGPANHDNRTKCSLSPIDRNQMDIRSIVHAASIAGIGASQRRKTSTYRSSTVSARRLSRSTNSCVATLSRAPVANWLQQVS